MFRKRVSAGKAMSLPAGVGIGLCVCWILMLVMAAVAAAMLESGSLDLTGAGYCTAVILFLSAGLGTMLAAALVKGKRMQICMITAAAFWATMLGVNIIAFGGTFDGVFAGAVIVLIAGVLAACVGNKGKNGRFKLHKRKAYR